MPRTNAESYPLPMQRCCLTAEFILLTRIWASERVDRSKRISCAFAPPTANPAGIPAATVSNDRLVPVFPRFVGFSLWIRPQIMLWSWHHRHFANANQVKPNHRTVQERSHTGQRTRHVLPISGNKHELYSPTPGKQESLSTDSQFAVG
jgi:hypothetical protein